MIYKAILKQTFIWKSSHNHPLTAHYQNFQTTHTQLQYFHYS